MRDTPKLGLTPTTDAERDAVHVAIIPVTAAEDLRSGQQVGINAKGKISSEEPHIGVVDPFLTQNVKAGERCYLCLYPGSITSLRHDWTHPAFEQRTAQAPKTVQVVQKPTGLEGLWEATEEEIEQEKLRRLELEREAENEALRCNARKWVTELAESIGMTYEFLMQAAAEWNDCNEYTNMGSDERYSDVSADTWHTFWEYYTFITGKRVTDPSSGFFSCAC